MKKLTLTIVALLVAFIAFAVDPHLTAVPVVKINSTTSATVTMQIAGLGTTNHTVRVVFGVQVYVYCVNNKGKITNPFTETPTVSGGGPLPVASKNGNVKYSLPVTIYGIQPIIDAHTCPSGLTEKYTLGAAINPLVYLDGSSIPLPVYP